MKLRIHHFFDMIRDIGSGKPFVPHPYQHSYHIAAQEILADPHLPIEIVAVPDSACSGCIHLVNSSCDDVITHRADFVSKEEFNNHLDRRIMKICEIRAPGIYTPWELCRLAGKYLESIYYIYEGNDESHTRERKKNVQRGLKLYAELHSLERGDVL